MSALALLDVGPIEMLVLALAAIMLFGGDLPDIARRAGRVIGRLRAAANELTRQIDPPSDLLRLPDPDDAIHLPPPAPPTPAVPPTPPASASAPPPAQPGVAPSGSPAALSEDPPPPPT